MNDDLIVFRWANLWASQKCHLGIVFFLLIAGMHAGGNRANAQEVVQYNHPGLTVDLGVGLWAWPMPMDWDLDGDHDLVVSCPDVPHNGTYFFENLGGVFKPGVKVGPGMKDVAVSYANGQPRVLRNNQEFVDFLGKQFESTTTIFPKAKIHQGKGNVRFNVWRYVDYNGDQKLDIMVGADDWGYFGWDDGYDETGRWKRGPLHGYVYILLNEDSTNAETQENQASKVENDTSPTYSKPFRIQANGEDVNVYGNPMPNLADFDGDGDLDLICAEFLDGFTYFENVGTRQQPVFGAGKYLEHNGKKITMHVQMITPTAIDWDKDGDVDLVCGDEDGRVALIENVDHKKFLPPKYFQQQARDLKFGALVTPVSTDWDGDGDEDLICGNTSGNIAFIENRNGGNPPSWSKPVLLKANGETIHIQAGENGSIQGPAEAKWGYTTLDVGDWNHDGLNDIVANSIWGRVIWYQNIGSRLKPKLAAAKPIEVEWPGEAPKPAWTWWKPKPKELATQWRTTPLIEDWDGDGLNDLSMLDHEGYLALYRRHATDTGEILLPGQRIFDGGAFNSGNVQSRAEGPLQLNESKNGGSGRRKICLVDWDGDGKRDLLVNARNDHSKGVSFMRNMGETGGRTVFKDMGPIGDRVLAGHTTSPTVVDWNRDGIPDLLVGAEDGRLYHLLNPRTQPASSDSN